jgi:hypothetical protein
VDELGLERLAGFPRQPNSVGDNALPRDLGVVLMKSLSALEDERLVSRHQSGFRPGVIPGLVFEIHSGS